MNIDRSFYSVICNYRTGYGQGTDELLDRKDLIEWIATGQFHDIVRIFEFNPGEGWSRDVTADLVNEAIAWRENDGREWSEELADLARHNRLEAAE